MRSGARSPLGLRVGFGLTAAFVFVLGMAWGSQFHRQGCYGFLIDVWVEVIAYLSDTSFFWALLGCFRRCFLFRFQVRNYHLITAWLLPGRGVGGGHADMGSAQA